MNHPDQNWLSAYYDGELRGEKLRRVEIHLADCEQCRRDLQIFRQLSVLAQAVPLMREQAPAPEFTARVLSRLPETPETPAWETVLRFSWKLAPLAILLLWAFLQAVLIAANLLQAFLPLESFGDSLAGLLLVVGAGLGGFAGALLAAGLAPVIEGLGSLDVSALPVLTGLLSLIATAVSAILLWGWLATWWADQRRKPEIVI